jgi:serine/threonine protein phosphatase 1
MTTAGEYGQAALGWLRGRRGARTRWAAVPAGEAVYAIGDIHGRADLLDDLLRRVARDAAGHSNDQVRRLIFLGDYIDRGDASRAVIEALLRRSLPGFATVYLKGNHEQAMLDFLDGRNDGRAWLSYGGAETVMSYGLPAMGGSSDALRSALAAALPAEHSAFLRACILHYVAGDYVFVHAGARPGVALEAQDPLDLLWIREDFLAASEALPGKVVVHGHTVCKKPENLRHRINIDTGAFFSDRLTCLVLRGNTRGFLATSA